jgi:hypothetical protein
MPGGNELGEVITGNGVVAAIDAALKSITRNSDTMGKGFMFFISPDMRFV